ncbi:hypothetical protein [Mycobacterium sp.]|uniref:hypothetical protein n=1 Tax=Mycobacterium sp. TaxID=1785 RepID=UPI003F97B19C
MDNLLDLADQTAFGFERAIGVTNLFQCVWVYNRAIDIDGLRRFHRHLQRGRLSRRIERSPLPFGRHRWVSPRDQSDLEIVGRPRPREEFDAWLSEQADTPIDAEHGPGWHLAALPFTDGGAGVSLVVSHCLADGIGAELAIADAACGYDNAISWPAAASRRRWQALREDARQTVRDIPHVGRAAVAAARFLRKNRGNAGSTAPLSAPPPAAADERITPPTAIVFIDEDEWDARVNSLGGTSTALLAGVAARLGQQVGRVTADGLVTLSIAVSERTADDSRSNALANVDITVDPAPAATDLREIRAGIKRALSRRHEVPDERWALLPLVPLLPKRLIRHWVNVIAGAPATVGVSNIGTVPSIANRPDGTDADYLTARTPWPGLTTATAHRAGGILALLSFRVHQQITISVLAYQPGRLTSSDKLRLVLSQTLDDFSLTATIGWPSREPMRP